MKALRKATAFSLFALLSVAAVGCTDQADPSGETIPGASPSDGPNTTDIFEAQSSTLQNGSESLEILHQVAGVGTTSLAIGPMPSGYSHLGIAVQCAGTGKWSASVDSEGAGEVSSDCSLNAGAAGLFDLNDPTASRTVTVNVADGTDIWVTVFADSPEEADS